MEQLCPSRAPAQRRPRGDGGRIKEAAKRRTKEDDFKEPQQNFTPTVAERARINSSHLQTVQVRRDGVHVHPSGAAEPLLGRNVTRLRPRWTRDCSHCSREGEVMRTATTGDREAGPSPADEARSRQVPHLSGSRCSALTRLPPARPIPARVWSPDRGSTSQCTQR